MKPKPFCDEPDRSSDDKDGHNNNNNNKNRTKDHKADVVDEEKAFESDTERTIPLPPLHTQPPTYQRLTIQRGTDDDKCCRICLQDDHPETMIAPCRCKGTSKWVHRECLDEWRTNEPDRAFSQCTECHFKYHLEPPPIETPGWRRRANFCMLVSRDICTTTILSQLAIALSGLIIYTCDVEKKIPSIMGTGGSQHPLGVYYLFGFLLLLVLLGCYGSCLLCKNSCSAEETMSHLRNEYYFENDGSSSSRYGDRAGLYQERRRYHHHRRRVGGYCCHGGYYVSPQPYYCDCDACCRCTYFCCGGGGRSSRGGHGGAGSNTNIDCCPRGNCDCDCGRGSAGDGLHVLLVLLLIIAIILAVIGFVVGIFITIFLCQRIVQRHIYTLHKRKLVWEFQVADLSRYDLDNGNRHQTNHGNDIDDDSNDNSDDDSSTQLDGGNENEYHLLQPPVTYNSSSNKGGKSLDDEEKQKNDDMERTTTTRMTPLCQIPPMPVLSESDTAYLRKVGLVYV